jgi:plastocyanin
MFGVVVAVTAGCGGMDDSNGSSQTSRAAQAAEPVECDSVQAAATVESKRSSYESSSVSVATGDIVEWVNEDGFPHTVTSGTEGDGSGAFDSGRFGQDQIYCLRFPETGSVDYFRTVHGAEAMSGTVEVGG